MTTPLTTTRPVALTQPGRVIERAFALLEAWDHRGETLGAAELARRTGLPKSTSHRLLGILETAGLVERLSGSYRLGARLRGLSGVLGGGSRPHLRDASLPFLQDLYELTHETVHLAVLSDNGVHCVEKLHGHLRSPAPTRVGETLPMHSTALGKALLAHSPQPVQRTVLSADLPRFTDATIVEPLRLAGELRSVRRNGLALDRRETHPLAVCVAAPVLDEAGVPVAAISVSGPADRFNPVIVFDRLRRAARSVSLAVASAQADLAA